METRGRHILMELWGCDCDALNSTDVVFELMREAVEVSGATPVLSSVRRFEPQGVTGIMMVQESHFSIHTWPEVGYAAIDAYTCGVRCDPMKSVDVFQRGLKAESIEVQEIIRGVRKNQLLAAVS